MISKLAPTAPLVHARVLAAVTVQRHTVQRQTVQRHTVQPASSTAKTIAALAASLDKK